MPTVVDIPGTTILGIPEPLPDFRDSPGTLLHLNRMHLRGPWAAGFPVDGALLPNIAWYQAAQLIGAGDPTSLSAKWVNSGWLPAEGKAELTAKGAPHIIPSKTTAVGGHYQHIDMPDLVASYIASHQTDGLYMSLAGRITRVGGTQFIQRLSAASGGAIRATFIETTASSAPVLAANPTSGTQILGRGASVSTPGLFMLDIATNDGPSGWTAGAAINKILNFFGPPSATYAATSPAWAMYDTRIESLTLSGKTYSDAHTQLVAWYTKEILTTGGMYYGDTFTDPATVS